ncbi:PIN domain-containing protein [Candidatus Bathyarchaeota archaeon]|nr:PIN domain-containing protein [Candidatus Bathyarchaeota archaeon]
MRVLLDSMLMVFLTFPEESEEKRLSEKIMRARGLERFMSALSIQEYIGSIHKIAKITTKPETYLRKADELLKGLLMHEKTPVQFVPLNLLSLLLRSKELREIGLGLNDSLIVSTAEKMDAVFTTTDEEILRQADKILVAVYTPQELLKQLLTSQGLKN